MAREDNLKPGAHQFTQEERSRGGKASAVARKNRKTMREMLQLCLDMEDKKGRTLQESITLGLIQGAIRGNAQNFRTIVEVLGELNNAEMDKKAYEISKVEELLDKITDEANK